MHEKLTVQELKALCQFFYDEGYNRRHTLFTSPAGREARGEKWSDDFETTFNYLMAGKYDKNIKDTGMQLMWDEMQAEIQRNMDKWDEENKGKAQQAIIDLRNIIIPSSNLY